MKQRNAARGCRRIAQQIARAFNIPIDKDVVRRILAGHYRPAPQSESAKSLLPAHCELQYRPHRMGRVADITPLIRNCFLPTRRRPPNPARTVSPPVPPVAREAAPGQRVGHPERPLIS
jgi:hypothetical protein